ncbi:hypothetical protein SORBI_3003G388500, partial [Sorghum bicolor]
ATSPAISLSAGTSSSSDDDATISLSAGTFEADATSAIPAATAKLLATIKAVEKSVNFKRDTAAAYIEENNFEGLETYVVGFLTSVQGTEQHHHPGILCALYRAQISYLVREGRIRDAEAVFNEKVKPLLDNEDHLYKPKNLKVQVGNAEKRVELDVDILSLLLDYFGLYFPSTLMPHIERKASVFDFVGKRDVGGVEETHCLACRWVLPQGMSAGKLIKHYTDDAKVKHCFHVTEWMLSYLDTIKTEEGAGLVRNPFGKSVPEATVKAPEKRKRKPELQLSAGNLIMNELLLDGFLDLHSVICKFPFYLLKEQEESAKDAASKARKALSDMQSATNDILCLAFRSVNFYEPLDPTVFLSKFTVLATSGPKLLLLMFSLQHSKTKSMVQSLCHKLTDVEKMIVMAKVTGLKRGNVVVSAEGSSTHADTSTGSSATPPSMTSIS